MNQEFAIHPSPELVSLFREKPYQGQTPEEASLLFLSSDANYSAAISASPFFEFILEYHRDGVQFWHRHGKHHPFLLPEYPFDRRKDGVVFHRNFQKLGFSPESAHHISFVELLDVPTIGIKSKRRKDFENLLSVTHLRRLDRLFSSDKIKVVFVSSGVLSHMKKAARVFGLFRWINDLPASGEMFYKNTMIKRIYHFSSTQIHSQLREIRAAAQAFTEMKPPEKDDPLLNAQGGIL